MQTIHATFVKEYLLVIFSVEAYSRSSYMILWKVNENRFNATFVKEYLLIIVSVEAY